MDDVAAACGVTKLIVYRHFGSKEELYREILQQVFEDLGVELRAELAMPTHSGLGPRTLLTVARDDPAAFTLLWRHAAHEPQFAAYAADLRSVAVSVVRQLSDLDTGDELLDAWHSEALFGWLVETTLTWLQRGDPARDDEFVEQTSAGFRALRTTLTLRTAAVCTRRRVPGARPQPPPAGGAPVSTCASRVGAARMRLRPADLARKSASSACSMTSKRRERRTGRPARTPPLSVTSDGEDGRAVCSMPVSTRVWRIRSAVTRIESIGSQSGMSRRNSSPP